MGMRTPRRAWWAGGIGAGVAALVGIGVAVAPGATAAQELPPVTPEQLVQSVLTAEPGPLNGTVTVDNALGLPAALPGFPQAANGTSTARVWSSGDGKGRLSVPTPQGEHTYVDDGTTRWAYDSEDRTVTKAPARGGEPTPDGPQDPAAAATQLIGTLRESSTVSVDGTGEVAGRPVYQLVLDPKPTERTLLSEVRVAVDGEKRTPLQVTVLSNGSPEPALQAGFTDVTFGPQDPSLFTFTPPPGATVRDAPGRGGPGTDETPGRPGGPDAPGGPTVVGDGWDTVLVAKRPADGERSEERPDLSNLGTPVSGPWGSGRQITTAVGSAIVTDDGRFAAGAVPPQVLVEALTR